MIEYRLERGVLVSGGTSFLRNRLSERYLTGSTRRWPLNQWTYSSVANSTSFWPRQGLLFRMTYVLKTAMTDSASASSYTAPLLPTGTLDEFL